MLFIADHAPVTEVPSDVALPVDGIEGPFPLERRRGLRVWQSRPVKVFEPRLSRYFAGQTENISSTGLRIELPASMPLKPGAVVEVHVGLSSTGQTLANRRQMIPAKVIWVNRPSEGEGLRPTGRTVAGIEFLASIAAHLDAA